MKPAIAILAALVALAAIALRVARDAAAWREWDSTDAAGDFGVISPANSITLTYPRTEAWRFN